jgi:WD40 repeat protein
MNSVRLRHQLSTLAIDTFSGPVRDAVFSVDGNMLAGVSATNQFTVWNLPSLQLITNVLSDATFPGPILFSPDGSWRLLGRASGSVEFRKTTDWRLDHLWELSSAPTNVSPAPGKFLAELSFTSDGRLLAAACVDGSVRIYDAHGRHQSHRRDYLQPSTIPWMTRAQTLAWLPHSRTLVIGSFGGLVRFWNLDRSQDTLLMPEAGNVWALAVSADGKTLAVGTQDGAIKLFSIPARREITTLKGHLTYLDVLAFSPDGRLLVSSGGDGNTRVWSGVMSIDDSPVRFSSGHLR